MDEMTGTGLKKPLRTLILAAGKGTRMKSDLAKVLHSVCGKPMLSYGLDVAREVGSQEIVVVIGHQAGLVKETFPEEDLIFIEQRQQLGTGHAVLQARETFHEYEGTVLILCGDVPLLRASTLQALMRYHDEEEATLTVLTTVLDDPAHYGRIIKDRHGAVLRIVEARDATVEEKKIHEINSGIYCVEGGFLYQAVGEIKNDNAQREYYLTDMVSIASSRGYRVRSFIARDSLEVMGINTFEELYRATSECTRRQSLSE